MQLSGVVSFLLFFIVPLIALPTPDIPLPASNPDPWSISWSHDFDGASGSMFDTSVWDYETPEKNGNNEIQIYKANADNAKLSGDGTGVILPMKQPNGLWTSARLYSKDSFTCEDGKMMRIQAEIKLGDAASNEQQGIWPAFWVLGDSIRHGGQWPAVGEIDIMEVKNGDSINAGTVHWGRTNHEYLSNTKAIDRSPGLYQVYSISINRAPENWEAQTISWELNGTQYYQVSGTDIGDEEDWTNLAQSPLFIILNVAVGGDYPGPPNDNTASGPDVGMEVKYVAVYNHE